MFKAGESITLIAETMGRAVDSILIKLTHIGLLKRDSLNDTYAIYEVEGKDGPIPYWAWSDEALNEWILTSRSRAKIALWRNDQKLAADTHASTNSAAEAQIIINAAAEAAKEEEMQVQDVIVEKRVYINNTNAADISDDKLIDMLATLKAKRKYLIELTEGNAQNGLLVNALEKVDGQIADLNEYMDTRSGRLAVAGEADSAGEVLREVKGLNQPAAE